MGTQPPTLHRPCGQPTFTALTGDRCAVIVRVDTPPLSPTGEVAALTAGRRTYAARGKYLEPRDRWTIPGRPPSADNHVHAEHTCQPIPATWLLPPAPEPTIPTDMEVLF